MNKILDRVEDDPMTLLRHFLMNSIIMFALHLMPLQHLHL